MNGFKNSLLVLTCVVATMFAVGAPAAQAATVTPFVRLNFNGTITGSAGSWTYNPGYGEVVPSGFQVKQNWNALVPTISAGVATFSNSGNNSTMDMGFRVPVPTGTLDTTNYLVEARVKPTMYGPNPSTISAIFGADKLEIRFNPQSETANLIVDTPDAPATWDTTRIYTGSAATATPKNAWTNLAVVYTPYVSTFYINGVLTATSTTGNSGWGYGNLLSNSTSNPIGLGLEVFNGPSGPEHNNGDRGYDGLMDGIALSTFTGTFNPATDFTDFTVSEPSDIPEPATMVLLATGLAGLLRRARRRMAA